MGCLSLLLAGCASGSKRLSACSHVRVMTWNIAAGHGDIARTARVIASKNADIIALQEVDVRWSERSSFVDQTDSLAKLLHMKAAFAPIYEIGTRKFGVAILSRYPIVTSTNHSITRLSTQQQNATPAKAPGFLEASIDVNGTRVRAFSTHLDYRADPSVRRTQVGEMIEIMRQSNTPLILFGDLNAGPDADELAPLRFLRDAGEGMTYPAQSPTKRIDYVLVSSQLSVSDVRADSTDASDHRPVTAMVNPCRISR